MTTWASVGPGRAWLRSSMRSRPRSRSWCRDSCRDTSSAPWRAGLSPSYWYAMGLLRLAMYAAGAWLSTLAARLSSWPPAKRASRAARRRRRGARRRGGRGVDARPRGGRGEGSAFSAIFAPEMSLGGWGGLRDRWDEGSRGDIELEPGESCWLAGVFVLLGWRTLTGEALGVDGDVRIVYFSTCVDDDFRERGIGESSYCRDCGVIFAMEFKYVLPTKLFTEIVCFTRCILLCSILLCRLWEGIDLDTSEP